MKSGSTSLTISEMQIKTTVTSHLLEWVSVKKTKIANVGKNVGKGELLYTADGNVNWYSHYGKEYVDSSKKIKIEQPYYPEISPVGIYPNGMKTDSQWDICMPMFTEALFKTTKIWKQSKI